MSDATLEYFAGIPDKEIDQACSDLEAFGLKCEALKVKAPGPQSSIEWFLPTAIVLFIAKPYLQSFLAEMGKDHYGLLKKGLVRLWTRFFGKSTKVPHVTVLTADGIRKPEYTRKFSIVATSDDDRKIKLMLPDGIDEAEFTLHIEAFLDFLYRHYAKEDAAIIPKMFNIKGIDDHIFVTLSVDKRGIRFLDPLPQEVRKRVSNNQPTPEDG